MKISRIGWKNFRPFEQESINFEGMSNVVVFTWENGTGKTAFINSIYWCFYGEELTPRRRYIPNGAALKRAFSDNKPTLDVGVDVSLSGVGDGQNVTISRTQTYRVKGLDEVEPHGTPALTVSLLRSDGLGYDPVADPDGWLRANLPKDISKHFLLDGQNFSNFSVNNSAVKDAVAEIANISAAEKLADHLETVVQELAAAIAPKKTRGGPNVVRAVRQRLMDQKKHFQTRVAELQAQVEEWIRQNGEPEQFLRDANRASELKGELELLRRTKQDAAIQLDESNKQIKEMLGSVVPTQLVLGKISAFLEEFSDRGEFAISSAVLKKLLDRSECICGCQLLDGSEQRDKIHELMSVGRSEKDGPGSSNLERSLRGLRDEGLTNSGRLLEVWRNLRKAEEAKALAERRLEDFRRVNEEEGKNRDGALADAAGAQALYRIVVSDQAALKELVEKTIPGLDQELQAFAAAALQEPTDDPEAQKRKRLAEFAQSCATAARQIHQTALGNVRSDVETYFTEVYKSMIAEFSTIAQTVKLTEDFAVEMYDADGQERSTGFSTGWGLTAAFAFATALDQLQGYEMPLIVDTPFAATSANIRRQLVSSVVSSLGPGGVSAGRQALFLSIDTELTDDVIHEFSKVNPTYVTGRYDAATQVTKIDVSEVGHG